MTAACVISRRNPSSVWRQNTKSPRVSTAASYHLRAGAGCRCVSRVNAIHVLMSKSLFITLYLELQLHFLDPIAPFLLRKSLGICGLNWPNFDERKCFRDDSPIAGFRLGSHAGAEHVCDDIVQPPALFRRAPLDLVRKRFRQIDSRILIAI